MVSDWIKSNSWALVLVIASFIASYSVITYKIGEVEKTASNNAARISIIEQNDVQTKVTLAQIQKDIEFIKYQLSKLVK